MPGLEAAARAQLVGPVVSVDLAHARVILEQFQETAAHRGWTLLAVAVMFNHVHLVVEAPAEIGKALLLRDFKSYASRRLSQEFGKPESGTWWTAGGSCRVVRNVRSAVEYVCLRQAGALVVWRAEGEGGELAM